MNGKLLSAVLALVLGILATGVAAARADDSDDRDDRKAELVIGVRLDFTSSTHAEGTFAACCVVNDSGRAQADVTSFTPKHNNIAKFEAIETFSGANGTFAVALRGRTGPLDSARHIARGTWRVVSGTGAYAGLRGRGDFTAVTDQVTGALTAVNSGDGKR